MLTSIIFVAIGFVTIGSAFVIGARGVKQGLKDKKANANVNAEVQSPTDTDDVTPKKKNDNQTKPSYLQARQKLEKYKEELTKTKANEEKILKHINDVKTSRNIPENYGELFEAIILNEWDRLVAINAKKVEELTSELDNTENYDEIISNIPSLTVDSFLDKEFNDIVDVSIKKYEKVLSADKDELSGYLDNENFEKIFDELEEAFDATVSYETFVKLFDEKLEYMKKASNIQNNDETKKIGEVSFDQAFKLLNDYKKTLEVVNQDRIGEYVSNLFSSKSKAKADWFVNLVSVEIENEWFKVSNEEMLRVDDLIRDLTENKSYGEIVNKISLDDFLETRGKEIFNEYAKRLADFLKDKKDSKFNYDKFLEYIGKDDIVESEDDIVESEDDIVAEESFDFDLEAELITFKKNLEKKIFKISKGDMFGYMNEHSFEEIINSDSRIKKVLEELFVKYNVEDHFIQEVIALTILNDRNIVINNITKKLDDRIKNLESIDEYEQILNTYDIDRIMDRVLPVWFDSIIEKINKNDDIIDKFEKLTVSELNKDNMNAIFSYFSSRYDSEKFRTAVLTQLDIISFKDKLEGIDTKSISGLVDKMTALERKYETSQEETKKVIERELKDVKTSIMEEITKRINDRVDYRFNNLTKGQKSKFVELLFEEIHERGIPIDDADLDKIVEAVIKELDITKKKKQ